MTEPKTCSIRWIDSDGNPTPDENIAVGEVRCLGYPLTGPNANPSYKPTPTRWFPICATHKTQMPADGYWEFREVSR